MAIATINPATGETLETFDRAAWSQLGVAAGDAVLRCGNADGAGWRHIADGHTGDFGELAALVDAGWEDVAWFAIDRALERPTVVERYRDDIVNYDVLVDYVDGDLGPYNEFGVCFLVEDVRAGKCRISRPPVAKFGMSAWAAAPSGEARAARVTYSLRVSSS